MIDGLPGKDGIAGKDGKDYDPTEIEQLREDLKKTRLLKKTYKHFVGNVIVGKGIKYDNKQLILWISSVYINGIL